LINGKEIDVESTYEFQRLGQSFRLACDRKGYYRQGRMMRKRPNEKGGFTVYLSKPLQLLADVEKTAQPQTTPAKKDKPVKAAASVKAKLTAKTKSPTKAKPKH
jgi:topoisomerase IA-like protein